MNADRPDQLDTVDEFEEFDHDDFGEEPAAPKQSFKDKIVTLWHDNPGFKMLVILGVGAVVLLCVFLFMNSSSRTPDPAQQSHITGTDNAVKGTPGADVSAEYKKILDESNKKTAEQALKTGGSAIPTPVGNVADTAPLKPETPVDPLAMWRQAEKPAEPPPAAAPVPVQQQAQQQQQQAQQQQQQQTSQETQQLAQAMQQQISSLMQAWGPTSATVVTFTQPVKTTTNSTTNINGTISGGNADVVNGGTSSGNNGSLLYGSGGSGGPTSISATNSTTTTGPNGSATVTQTAATRAKVIVPAGDINYGTLITEANSDVPGPILAQIQSGPLKGGRLIGSFTSTDEYLILKFTTLSIYGHSYEVDAIALDPATTLGAVATETDQRYFSRLVLPAAASFISRFGQAISTPPTTTSQSASSTVITTQPSTTQDALYGGLGDAAQQVSNFVNAAGNQIRPLVRVASNTAIGIFFTKAVTDQPDEH